MIRDPFYQDIIRGLSRRLDPELFERCATALLRPIHPTLVPIRGGNDAGMDGAIADCGGLPFPFVCTTGKDVIGNLKKSLKSYVKEGGPRRLVVLATSRELSQRKRKNLNTAASALGFTLVQIHTQAAFADLLYRSPEWCLELLNLTGDLPALSVLPLTDRPLAGQSLIGRDVDFSWLCDTPGDLLLVGQPGSGKTFIFHTLAKQGRGLFIIDENRSKIAAGIRAQRPAAVLFDDAHLSPRFLTSLRHLRNELGADFRIIANCWPGDQEVVARSLNISEKSIRSLLLLSRDDIPQPA